VRREASGRRQPLVANVDTALLVMGAGQSTLTNTLTGAAGDGQSTREVRAGDERGRHTTTARTLHR
jgi:ribosome biogenesis GTPase